MKSPTCMPRELKSVMKRLCDSTARVSPHQVWLYVTVDRHIEQLIFRMGLLIDIKKWDSIHCPTLVTKLWILEYSAFTLSPTDKMPPGSSFLLNMYALWFTFRFALRIVTLRKPQRWNGIMITSGGFTTICRFILVHDDISTYYWFTD